MERSAFCKYRLLALLLLSVVAIGISWFVFRTKSSGRIRNILLISIDTCRADYLSCYGYLRKTTPNIDAIAAEGILFKNVVSPIPLTLPAHSSMLTGTIPPYHAIHDNLGYDLADSNVTLAEILKDNGFVTGAVIATFVLDSRFGLDHGFDTYNDRFDEELKTIGIAERRGNEVSSYGIKWLAEHKDQPFFLFLHYYDPHYAYEPPEPFNPGLFSDKYSLYAGEISYADHCIGRVIEKLKGLGIYDSTLIIITSDHGEALGEHLESSHGYFIYDETIKVPLIFKLPGKRQPRQINDSVGLIDIVPTVCSLLGIREPSQIQGKDLSRYLRKKTGTGEERYFYCESMLPTKYQCNSLLGVTTDRWKYIQTTRPELYDLADDPEETNNLVGEQPQRARIMQDRLKQILEQTVRKGPPDSKMELDEEAKKRLESLGYVASGTIDESFEFDQTKDDPKDYADFHDKRCRVNHYIRKKQFDRAKELCKQMISEHPDNTYTYVLLGNIAFQENEFGNVVTYYSQALRLNPEDYKTQRGLGLALSNQSKFDEAVGHFKEALRLKPDFRDAHYNLGVAYAHLGKLDDAIKHWKEALKYGSDPRAHVALADALAYQGKLEQAITHWKESLKLEPDNAKVHADLAGVLARKGKIEEAVLHFTESVRLSPNQPIVQNVLAELLYTQGKTDEAISHWKLALRFQPDTPGVLNNLAWIMAVHEDNKFRNPSEALQYAQRACELTEFKNPDLLDTLSAAHAAVGNFDKAIETAERALKLYRDLGLEKKADDLQNRLELFRKGQPYREKL